MIIKAFNITLGIFVALCVWGAAVVVALIVLHVLVICGSTVFHVLNS